MSIDFFSPTDARPITRYLIFDWLLLGMYGTGNQNSCSDPTTICSYEYLLHTLPSYSMDRAMAASGLDVQLLTKRHSLEQMVAKTGCKQLQLSSSSFASSFLAISSRLISGLMASLALDSLYLRTGQKFTSTNNEQAPSPNENHACICQSHHQAPPAPFPPPLSL